ncbi:MAG: hypothetical protein GTO02_08140, partial [Candidatus Dadabacteria bacterium]|nr:hypothetical protein [Candidatus Dadabacteria bacterium]
MTEKPRKKINKKTVESFKVFIRTVMHEGVTVCMSISSLCMPCNLVPISIDDLAFIHDQGIDEYYKKIYGVDEE